MAELTTAEQGLSDNDLSLNETEQPIGKWEKHKAYLKEHRPILGTA